MRSQPGTDRAFTVLCVDDNEDSRVSTAFLLANAGYRVLEAATGRDALRLAGSSDLVILDVVLPDIPGGAVCSRIKADSSTALVPVIFLSGYYTSSEDRAGGLEGGADAYLIKPADPGELLGQVKALLRIRRAELLLLASEERHRRIVETSAEGIWVVDGSARTTFSNNCLAQLLGSTCDDLMGRSLFEFTTPTAQPQAEAILAPGESGAVRQREFAFRRRDGSAVWCLVSASPHQLQAGAGAGTLLMVTDITERRQLEEQYLRTQKLAGIGRLAGGIAHDFNNLLAVISGSADVLLREEPAGPRREAAEHIRESADRAATLVRQLLAFSRRQTAAPRVLRLNDVLAELETMLRRVLGGHIELVTQFCAEPDRILADPGQVEQVVLNLVVNARDAMERGGRLVLATSTAPPKGVRLTVADTGCGIPHGVLPRIFEPFFTTKEVGKGTGLGLAVVHGIVEQYGGRLTVESEPGAGTTIHVDLLDAAEGGAVDECEHSVNPCPSLSTLK